MGIADVKTGDLFVVVVLVFDPDQPVHAARQKLFVERRERIAADEDRAVDGHVRVGAVPEMQDHAAPPQHEIFFTGGRLLFEAEGTDIKITGLGEVERRQDRRDVDATKIHGVDRVHAVRP
ncbi:hypothetical protein D3C72_1997720 [compost metagenome]